MGYILYSMVLISPLLAKAGETGFILDSKKKPNFSLKLVKAVQKKIKNIF